MLQIVCEPPALRHPQDVAEGHRLLKVLPIVRAGGDQRSRAVQANLLKAKDTAPRLADRGKFKVLCGARTLTPARCKCVVCRTAPVVPSSDLSTEGLRTYTRRVKNPFRHERRGISAGVSASTAFTNNMMRRSHQTVGARRVGVCSARGRHGVARHRRAVKVLVE